MPLYINQEVIIVNNQSENVIFLFDRKNRIKSIINEDMFEILSFIYEHEGITIEEFSNYYCNLEEVINQLLDSEILSCSKQKRCNNINYQHFNVFLIVCLHCVHADGPM